MYRSISAICILVLGKYDEALVYYEEALDASRSVLGNTHPDTLVYIGNMAHVLYTQGDTYNISILLIYILT